MSRMEGNRRGQAHGNEINANDRIFRFQRPGVLRTGVATGENAPNQLVLRWLRTFFGGTRACA